MDHLPMREIRTAILVKAPASVVRQILTDLPAYPEWNPFITRIQGVLRIDETLSVTLRPPGDAELTLTPRVITACDLEIAWLGHLWIQGLFDGEHHFVIRPENRMSCTFVQYELFRGILVPFTGRLFARTKQGFEAMNLALKRP
jgi:hypothetical protein